TPLQVNMFTNYFANNGKSFRPRFVKEIVNGEKREELKSEVYKERIVDAQYVHVIREGLRQGVLMGSGRRLSLLPVSSAGKTGTAQSTKGRAPHAWFTGWAPYENPEVSITVLIEEGEEGSRTAVPVAYEILKWYFEQKHVDKNVEK
ncbi:MAG: penicillin-binding transpeptidase domain-containing protein, partial [bacterium]|nr:penicillin-binding transpeptidase domain-containing protein [bacterium]